jgi:hypothetical protein
VTEVGRPGIELLESADPLRELRQAMIYDENPPDARDRS